MVVLQLLLLIYRRESFYVLCLFIYYLAIMIIIEIGAIIIINIVTIIFLTIKYCSRHRCTDRIMIS